MTTEEKATKYDEALEWMRKVYPTLTGADKEDAEHYFPELKESEDERIRKELLAVINDLVLPDEQKARFNAWLEKQKENPKSADSIPSDCISDAKCENKHNEEGDFVFELRQIISSHRYSDIYGEYTNDEEGMASEILELCKCELEKQKEQPQEELVYRLNDLMQEYVKEGEDDAEKEHRLKCYQLFWDALEDADFFEQKDPDGIWTEEDDAKVKVMCKEGDLKPSERAWLKELKNRIVKKEQKSGNNSTREKIISRATSEKQVVLISESSGEAEIGWDTRSLEDAKKLLEYGLAFINKNITDTTEKQKDSASNSFDDVWDEEDCEEIIAEGQKLTPRFKELLKEVCHAWYDRGVKLAEQKAAEFDEYKIIKKHITEDSLSSEVNKRLTECGWYVTDEKPKEWSEEDEEMLVKLLDSISIGNNYEEMRNWLLPKLKSFSPQSKQEQKYYWKPTETDVALFNKAVTTNETLTPAERAQLDIIRSKFCYCRATNCNGIVQPEQKPEAKLTGWVARDKDERLWVYDTYPEKDSEKQIWTGSSCMPLDQKSFPDLKWEDEPMEVEITIRKK